MKKTIKKILLFSLLLVLLAGENKNIALASINSDDSNQELLVADSLLVKQFNRALEFYRNSEFIYAEQSFKNAIKTIEKGDVKDLNMIYRTYVNFGVIKRRIGKRRDALQYFNLAEKFTINHYGEGSQKLVPIYVNSGNIYNDLLDLFKAQSYYEKALSLIGDGNSRYLSQINNNLGNIHYGKHEYTVALNFYKESLLIKENAHEKDRSSTLNGIANCYKQLKNYKEADLYYLKSINDIKSFGDDNHYKLGTLYLNYGIFQSKIKKKDNALKYLELALRVYISNYGENHPDVANCLQNLGEFYGKQRQNRKSLYFYQKALVSELENFSDSSIYRNPDVNRIEPQISLLRILKGKAKSFSELYDENKKISDLDFSLDTYDLCMEIIDKIRIGYQDEESKFALSQNEKDTYTVAIEIAVQLYGLTKDISYKERAFKYAERSKAASLMSSLNDINAKNIGGIPVELQEEEQQLRKDIANYREKIYEERKKIKSDRDKISEWQGKLFQLNESYNQMVLRFEKDYPKYYELKYKNSTIEMSELQSKLSSNDILIEYSISDSSLFTFIITSDSFEIKKQEINSDSLDFQIEEVRSALKTNDFAENSSEYYQRYTKSAFNLYQTFIAPHSKQIQNKKLIIVPDGKMAYVPFGVLIRHEADTNRMNYRDLDYLIKSNTITYQNSATIGFSIEPAGFSFTTSKSVLAFAPSYNGIDDSILYTERAYRDKLYPLPYTKEEVNNISNVMEGDLYLDELATEQNFKDHANGYDVLHLAMHTIIDDENPMYSKLVFTQTNDTVQDGLLNTHEIYNMNFNARMVVLSACNTGDGKLLKGEGVMSLARGFFYAGCPSIIMTLWTVEDQTGSNLMTNFYSYLSKGLDKDESLRQAKLKYLETADPLKSHPYFWSGYVTMGDVQPLYDFDLKNNLVYMGLGGLVLLVLVVFRRRIKRKVA
ncbi:CHAT domain-containing tetratricopeptide repeat protein [Marinifilum fragile]|uniref:CHAT domain-containing protein n=1 Tax=Marinifilum fragile TaxID=570161 RepID=UPI002AAB7B2D|nr:CHAT domain-containing tetratricopeptide repeat protein [Marinifilum fragile]